MDAAIVLLGLSIIVLIVLLLHNNKYYEGNRSRCVSPLTNDEIQKLRELMEQFNDLNQDS
jgi:hypothetical protein